MRSTQPVLGPSARATAARALADPIRVEIVRSLISNGSLRVAELVDHLAVPAPRLRHHLAMLCDQALIRCDRPGRVASYRITHQVVEDLLTALCTLADDCQ